MAKKTKAILSLEAIRSQLGGLRELTTPEFIPFRSDILNLFTGGVSYGGFLEIAGDPGLFKSTLAAEIIGAALDTNAYVIVHDKELKLEKLRFTTLGVHTANKNNPRFFYFRQNWPEYRLTIEQYFEDIQKLYTSIRHDDLSRLRNQFKENTASDEAYDYYRRYLLPDERNKTRTPGRSSKIAEKLVVPSLLRQSDKSHILTVLDSTTATPANEEAPDANGEVHNSQPAIRARVWSEQLRRMMWLDDRVAGLHLAQKRLALSFKGPSYQKAGVTTAQEFHYNGRLMMVRMSNGQLWRNPKGHDLLIGTKDTTQDDRIDQVGQIMLAKIDKSLKGLKTSVPLFMLGQSGTDVVNSMWQFLLQRGLIKHHYQGKHKFDHHLFTAIWPSETTTFKVGEFIDFYRAEGARLWSVLQSYLHLLLTGQVLAAQPNTAPVEMPSPFSEPKATPTPKKAASKKAGKKRGKKK